MVRKIILASKSKVRKEILDKNGLNCEVQPSNVDEDIIKESLESKPRKYLLCSPADTNKPMIKRNLSKLLRDPINRIFNKKVEIIL